MFRSPADCVRQISSLRLKLAVRIVVALSVMSATAMAQTPQSQPSPPAAPPAVSETAPPQKPAENSGLLGEIGKLLSAPAALLPSLTPADPAATPTPAPALAPAPTPIPAPPVEAENPPAGSRFLPGIVSGRELCPRSDNGAPDCKTGSDRLCRSKGYSGGNSLSTDAIFVCSAKPLQIRGKPCGTENYVTRAFSQ